MKNLIDSLKEALNKKGNRTTPKGTCVIHCSPDAFPMCQTLTTFSMQEAESSASEEVGQYHWGGCVGFSDWPYHAGNLSYKNGKRVILTCAKDNVQYKVRIIVRSKGTIFGSTTMPFWAVFEAVNEDEADNVHNAHWVVPRLKTEYIKELEERLVKHEAI